MQSVRGSVGLVQRHAVSRSSYVHFNSGSYIRSNGADFSSSDLSSSLLKFLPQFHVALANKIGSQTERLTWFDTGMRAVSMLYGSSRRRLFQSGAVAPSLLIRCMMMEAESVGSSAMPDVAPRIKFKRLDKTANRIMQILDKEGVDEVRTKREIPDITPGYIVQLRVEAPENKRRVSVVKGIVIARCNAGLNTTFRIRRLVAGVGVESLFPLYSPSIKEIKVLDKKKVRRAKLHYLRDKMKAHKKH